jgi:ribosome-associated translation inhibitor RaiA
MGSIDAVVHRMESQLRKYKEKIRQRHRSEPDREIHSESVTENLEDEKE